MTQFFAPDLIGTHAYFAPDTPPSSAGGGDGVTPVNGPTITVLATTIPAIRKIVFDGGRRLVVFT